MSDLINRQDAINAIKMVLDDGGEWFVEAVNDIPSAGQNCVLCEYYTEIETYDGIKGKCTRRTGSDLIRRQDAIRILASEMRAEAMSEGYGDYLIEDYIPEATEWMNDAPSVKPKTGRDCTE